MVEGDQGLAEYRLWATAGLGGTERVGERDSLVPGIGTRKLWGSDERVSERPSHTTLLWNANKQFLPCSWWWFDSDLAGCATVLAIPGTRETCENCRVVRRLLWRVRRKERQC